MGKIPNLSRNNKEKGLGRGQKKKKNEKPMMVAVEKKLAKSGKRGGRATGTQRERRGGI